MVYILAKSIKDARVQVRKLNREHRYGYKLDGSTIRHKGKSKTPGFKTYTVRAELKTGFKRYGRR